MERRYLVAALAMIATFAGVSRGFQSLQQLSLRVHNGQTLSVPLPSIVARALARIKTNLHQTDPEEAQLLAEMNLPIAALQAKAAEEAAKQSQAAADMAQAAAMREAERAHRDVQRMREQMARHQKSMTTIVSVQVPDYAALNQRIQVTTAAMAQRLAAQSARMQVAAARWQAASMQMNSGKRRYSTCGARGEMQ